MKKVKTLKAKSADGENTQFFSLVRKVRDKENKDAHIQRRPKKNYYIIQYKNVCV